MKAIITSDTHENAKAIDDIVKFAQANGISTVFDAGDLHGAIKHYEGIDLHAVYWGKASGAMDRWEFRRDVEDIGGIVHENGSTFKFEDTLIFMQHNLAGYEQIIPEERLAEANEALDRLASQSSEENPKRYILFGHTHTPHFLDDGKSIAINPGWVDSKGVFAVLDTDNNTIEYRTKDKVLLKMDENSDIKHFRDFRMNKDTAKQKEYSKYIAKLKNNKEVFVYNKDGQEKRTEEFPEIISAYISKRKISMEIKTEEGLMQLLHDDFRSKTWKKIGEKFNEYDAKGKSTGNLSSYVACKDIDGKEQEILVIGKDETESLAFDKINTKIDPMIKDNFTCFIGKTRIPNEKESKWDENKGYKQSIILNNQIAANYKIIEEVKYKDNKFIIRGEDDDKKGFIAVMNQEGKIEESKKYDSISDMELVDNNLVYIAKNNGTMFAVVNGEEQTKHDYDPESWEDGIKDAQFIGGKLTYVIKHKDRQSLFFDGKESEPVPKKDYNDGINYVMDINGKPGYIAQAAGKNPKIIVDGQVMLEEEKIDTFMYIGSMLAYQKKMFGECFWQDGTKIEGYKHLYNVNDDFESGKLKLPAKD